MNEKLQISQNSPGKPERDLSDILRDEKAQCKQRRSVPMLRSGKPDFTAIKARKRPLSKEYQAHIQSDYWNLIRKLCFERDGFKCVVCYASSDLDCHHRSYARFGNERLTDLTTLCRKCHEIFTEHGVLVKENL